MNKCTLLVIVLSLVLASFAPAQINRSNHPVSIDPLSSQNLRDVSAGLSATPVGQSKTGQVHYLLDSVYIKYKQPLYDTLFYYSLYLGDCQYDNQQRIAQISWVRVDSTSPPSFDSLLKYTYAYHMNGKLSSWYEYSYDFGSWIKTGGEEFTYNPADSLILRKVYTYYDYYRLEEIDTYEYDSIGQLVKDEWEWWEFAYPSHNHYKKHLHYDSAGNLVTDTLFSWVNAWHEHSCNVYIYNAQGLLQSESEYLSMPSWTVNQQITYAYDSSNRVRETILSNVNVPGGPLSNSRKGLYVHDSIGNQIQLTIYLPDSGSSWIPDTRLQSEYSPFGTLMRETYLEYDPNTQSWVNDWQAYNRMDGSGNIIEKYHCNWDTVVLQWDSTLMESTLYDMSKAADEVTRPELIDITYPWQSFVPLGGYANATVQRSEFSQVYFTLLSYERRRYSFIYSDIAASVGEISPGQGDYTIYPNPAPDILNISIKDGQEGMLLLLDLNGRVILTKEFSSHCEIDVSMLAAGCYLYRLVIQNNVHSGKVIIH